MINCNKNNCKINGIRSELFAEITLIFESLIKSGCIKGIEDLLSIFEVISMRLRNEFDNKEEK